jgi:uncharacterized protein YndB with AHSA1/START domain
VPVPKASNSSSLSLIVRRTIRASPERLFAAWTEAERLVSWWGPANVACPAAEIDLRVGGRYRIANTMPDGSTLWIAGEFLQIERPRLLVYSWRLEPEDTATERVTVRFESRGDATDVIVSHEHIADATTRDQHRLGWEGCLDGLQAYCAD